MTQIILIGEIRFYTESWQKQAKPCEVWPKTCWASRGQRDMYSASLLRTHSPRFTPTCICDMKEINGSSQPRGYRRSRALSGCRGSAPPPPTQCHPGSKITQQRGAGRGPGSSCLPRRAARIFWSCQLPNEIWNPGLRLRVGPAQLFQPLVLYIYTFTHNHSF